MKNYDVIYADPPWAFSSKELVKYGGERFTSMDKHYQTQGTKWIKSLDVGSLSAENCALFMWTTDAHLPDALEVIKAWGFKYKTVGFVWQKQTVKGNPVKVLGAWTMKSCEMCLFATKGKVLQMKNANNVEQLILAERTKHSKKPQEARRRIERLFGEQRRVELFAREPVDGWDVWGNEVASDLCLAPV